MKISSIKAQIKNSDRVSVYLDGRYAFSLSLDQLLTEKLKVGIELEKVEFERLKKVSSDGKLYVRSLEWALGRPHSKKELHDYLYRKKADNEQIAAITGRLEAQGYINDENFTRWFVEMRVRKNKSKKEIIFELRNKGVSPETIQSVVNDLLDDISQKKALDELLNKLSTKTRYADEQKLKRYLLSKGFSYDEISQAIRAKSTN